MTTDQLISYYLSRTIQDEITGCLEWQGATNGHGYPRARYNGRMIAIHRLIATGVLNSSVEVVMHMCDNRLCLNREHLRLGTYLANSHDAIAKEQSLTTSCQ